MNLEQSKNNKNNQNQIIDDLDFDFKPITSGLGFNHQKSTEPKSFITERSFTGGQYQTIPVPKKEVNVYKNDLSIFYGQNSVAEEQSLMPEVKSVVEKSYSLAGKGQRVMAYFIDLCFLLLLLSGVLIVMAKTVDLNLVEAWSNYPHEITPLFVTLFCGFYLMYFSIFEKTGSTLGKSLFGLRVSDMEFKSLSFSSLILRTVITLFNFISLGMFSYFDLQNKKTSSKVIKVK
jgi:uncharacterized RDD family membrane protein YckC